MGYDEKQSMQLATTATMFQNIADAEISAGDAALFINSQLKGFSKEFSQFSSEGEASMHVIDSVNEVANNFAVGTNDLQLALSKTSSAMGGFGNSYEQTIGIITAGTEIMVGQPAKVARGWRTIGANITKLAKSTDTYRDASGKVEIQMRKQDGTMKNTYEFLDDLHDSWGSLNEEQKTAIALEMGGKNQMEVFMATMNNFDTAIKATETAMGAQGSASRENAKALESLQGHLQNLKSAWEEFSHAMVNSDALKKGMDILAEGLHLLSTDAGQAIIKFAAMTTMANLFAKVLLSLKGLSLVKLFKGFGNLGKTAKGVEGVGKAAGKSAGGIGRLAGAFSKLSPFLTAGTLAGGILALSVALAKYVPIGEKAANIKINKEWAGAKSDLDETIKKYKELRDERKKLEEKQKKGTLTDSEANRLAILENQTEQYKRQVELKKELLSNKTTEKWKTVDPEQLEGKQKEEYLKGKGAFKSDKEALAGAHVYNKLDVAMGKVEARAKATADAEQKMIEAYEKYGKNSSQYTKALENYTEAADEQGNSLEYLQKWHDKAVKEFGSEEKASKALGKSWTKLNKQIKGLKVLGGLDLKKPSEGLEKLGSYAKDAGVDMKTLKDGTVQVDKINLDKFSTSMQQAGWDTEKTWEYIKNLGKEQPDMKVSINGVDTAVKDLEFVDGKIKAVDKEKAEPEVEEKGAKETEKNVDAAKRALAGLPRSTPVRVKESGSKDAKTKIGQVRAALAGLPSSKEIHITTYKTTIEGTRKAGSKAGKGLGKAIGKAGKSVSKGGNALGRKGTNTPSELSEVNERGFELIRDASTGQFRIAGGGKRTLTYLNRGDEVYTHAESLRMVRDDEDIMVPQFAKGTSAAQRKKKAAKKRAKKVSKLRTAFDRALETLEFKRDRYHWSEATFNKAYTKLVKKYRKKIKKVDKTKGLGTERNREYSLALSDTSHDVGIEAVEGMIENMYYDDKTTLKDITNKIAKLRKQRKITAKEAEDLRKEAYKTGIEYNLKMYENDKKSLDATRDYIKSSYDKKKISAQEYYDYLEQLGQIGLEKEEERLNKQVQLREDKYDLARTYVQYRINMLEKENEEQEKQNELIKLQNDLLKAQNKKVKIYKEGQGFVYEKDTEAIKEATDALKEYQAADTGVSGAIKAWQDILDMMDEMDVMASIKDLELKVGSTVSTLFDNMGTDLEQWTNWVSKLLSEKMGYEDLVEQLGGLSTYEQITGLLGTYLKYKDTTIAKKIEKNALGVISNYVDPITTGTTPNVAMGATGNSTYAPLSITVNGLTLPSVTDANSFINELQNLALQSSTTRG